MSVRRTVAQSSAGLLLLAAFAAGPTAVYAAPGDPSEGGSGEPQCTQDETGQYQTTLSVAPSQVAPGDTVSLTMHCFPGPERETALVTVTAPDGSSEEAGSISSAAGGTKTLNFPVPEDAEPGDYLFVVRSQSFDNNAPFEVVGSEDSEGGSDDEGEGSGDEKETPPSPDPEPEPGEDEPDNGSGDNGSDDSEEPGEGTEDPGSGDEGQDADDDSQDQGDDDSGSGEDDQEQGDDDQNSGDDGSADDEAGDGSDSGSDDEQKQDSGNGDESGDAEGSDEEEQQGGDTTASGSRTQPFPGDEQVGDTSASAANDNAASKGKAPAQPPAAPGSATNDFPAAQQEATADQKQSAALAVLMTKLFAGGVSSGSVGTTPDQARTVIDPSAGASEIEVPAGSDTGGSSDSGSGSESSDGDALAATGSNMLLPAGIAAAAILLGAGLKIHQLRRGL